MEENKPGKRLGVLEEWAGSENRMVRGGLSVEMTFE